MTLSSDPKASLLFLLISHLRCHCRLAMQSLSAIPTVIKPYSFTIQDIYPYNTGFSAFMPRNQLNQLLHEDHTYFNGYLSNQPLDIEEAYVQSVVTRSDLVKINEQMTQAFSQLLRFDLGIHCDFIWWYCISSPGLSLTAMPFPCPF